MLAAPGKPAKQVVRDVQSLAMAQFDIDLDHRIVSVVQIEDDSADAQQPATPLHRPATRPSRTAEQILDEIEAQARPVISEIGVRSTGSEIEVEVRLELDGDTFVGIERGAAAASARPAPGGVGDHQRARRAARASGRGRERRRRRHRHLTPSRWSCSPCRCPGSAPQSVAGSAVVRGDETDAVARAVLAAVNRRLGWPDRLVWNHAIACGTMRCATATRQTRSHR